MHREICRLQLKKKAVNRKMLQSLFLGSHQLIDQAVECLGYVVFADSDVAVPAYTGYRFQLYQRACKTKTSAAVMIEIRKGDISRHAVSQLHGWRVVWGARSVLTCPVRLPVTKDGCRYLFILTLCHAWHLRFWVKLRLLPSTIRESG